MSFSASHPQFSEWLVHLTGRNRNHAPGTPVDRLDSILRNTHIKASTTYSRCRRPYVAFTEFSVQSLDHVFSKGDYAPWGIVFRKDLLYADGGAPALYVRTDEWAETAEWSASTQARVVRFDPTRADWMWEREWRVAGIGGFHFAPSDIVALIAPADTRRCWSTLGGTPPSWFTQANRANKVWKWSRNSAGQRRAS